MANVLDKNAVSLVVTGVVFPQPSTTTDGDLRRAAPAEGFSFPRVLRCIFHTPRGSSPGRLFSVGQPRGLSRRGFTAKREDALYHKRRKIDVNVERAVQKASRSYGKGSKCKNDIYWETQCEASLQRAYMCKREHVPHLDSGKQRETASHVLGIPVRTDSRRQTSLLFAPLCKVESSWRTDGSYPLVVARARYLGISEIGFALHEITITWSFSRCYFNVSRTIESSLSLSLSLSY